MEKPTRELVNAFLEWFQDHPHSAQEDHYAGTLTLENLSQMDRQQFIEFFHQFAYDGGHVQSGGPRTAVRFRDTIEAKYDEFRAFVLEPFTQPFNEIEWFQRIHIFSHFGTGLATIFLNRVNKKLFAINNEKAVEAVELLDMPVSSVPAQRYQAVLDAWRQLIEWYPEFENFYRADALSQFLIGEESGRPWADQLRAGRGGTGKRYWIYAPGEGARHWDEFSRKGLMGLGWDELGDLSFYETQEELHQVVRGQLTANSSRQVCDFVQRVREGDGVFVKRGTKTFVGYGEVTSGYFFEADRSEYKHVRRVNWLTTGEWQIPQDWKSLPRKTLTELRGPERIRQYQAMLDIGGSANWTSEAFRLLEQLHLNPTAEFYHTHAEEFKQGLEQPFQQLLGAVAQRLRPEVTELMETEKRIFSRIRKNDFGRGGAWDFYWGAFYPRGDKRTESAQLFVGMHEDYLEFGFYIGEYGSEQRGRFTQSCSQHLEILEDLLMKPLSRDNLQFGETSAAGDYRSNPVPGLKWNDWLNQVEQSRIRVGVRLSRNEVQVMSDDTLAENIADVFHDLFPLVLLATKDDPLTEIRRYVGEISIVEETLNPEYSLEQCAAETHFDLEVLQRWARAIERKKQAIFYGPPGTGKTFVAERLALHLIGEGDGFTDIVQFHPSYAYEDFMQGLRPSALSGGGLEYVMTPGRFKEFCDRARERKGPCVLIIDEINRANLSRVLGELMYLLEYRDQSVPLSGGGRFQIPQNVRIIGTMNTADRSIALVDNALRRRFAFLELRPNYEVLRRYHANTGFDPEGLINLLERLNADINDRHYSVGISFFLSPSIEKDVADIWQMELEPYIEELFFDQPDKAAGFEWDKVKEEIMR